MVSFISNVFIQVFSHFIQVKCIENSNGVVNL